MPPSHTLAIAAHLHVLLRRKTGRVTDTEWMASNVEYAFEIVRFATARAADDGHPELQEWADKLLAAIQQPATARRPLVQGAMQALRPREPLAPIAGTAAEQPPASGFGASRPAESGRAGSTLAPARPGAARDPDTPRYIGGIR